MPKNKSIYNQGKETPSSFRLRLFDHYELRFNYYGNPNRSGAVIPTCDLVMRVCTFTRQDDGTVKFAGGSTIFTRTRHIFIGKKSDEELIAETMLLAEEWVKDFLSTLPHEFSRLQIPPKGKE